MRGCSPLSAKPESKVVKEPGQDLAATTTLMDLRAALATCLRGRCCSGLPPPFPSFPLVLPF